MSSALLRFGIFFHTYPCNPLTQSSHNGRHREFGYLGFERERIFMCPVVRHRVRSHSGALFKKHSELGETEGGATGGGEGMFGVGESD